MRIHYGPWQPCWISNQHQKHKSGRGPSSERFWQVWLISVQRFQRRRFKCEKLTDGQRTLTHDKSSHGLWPGELKRVLATASDKAYQLLAHGQWFSPTSSTTKIGRHEIAEILLRVALNTKKNQIIVIAIPKHIDKDNRCIWKCRL